MSQTIRVEGSVTSLSWIPREAIEGMTKIPFEVSMTRYDQPPPDRLTEGSLATLQDAGRFRFLNRLWAWAEIEDGKIVRYGHEGQSLIGKTRVKLGREQAVDKLGDLAVSQATQPEPGHSRPSFQLGEPLPDAAGQLILTKGADQHDRLVTQPDRQEGKQLAGRVVGPVQVLQHEHDR